MQLVAADVDMDGKVTAADALHILQYLVGQNDLCEKNRQVDRRRILIYNRKPRFLPRLSSYRF